ncbi:rubredoxin [Hymenobacter caeli]|uniref:Rubredoxin n=1 Tax=Hymenobacter caeli TaxID=2735894 RepID=A0ABX2FW54_9BACT|nr:rubredoxin domain-containing protein [Hymenobacter caeli]NRT21202.1 rubredoxin [Hymenobacter caeli]
MHTIRINLPGGIVPAGDLLAIAEAAAAAGAEYLHIGHRQQLLVPVEAERLDDLVQALAAAGFAHEVDAEAYPNISSSYVVEDVFHSMAWLREGVYKDVLDLFDYRPRLKINLVDKGQTFVPFFTGNLNFIASDTPNYWYLYVRFPRHNALYCWPSLVYSEDIPGLSSAVERVVFAHREQFYDQPAADGALLYGLVNAAQPFGLQAIAAPLALPPFTLPYYEGFNRYGGKLWLGIYRRDERFALAFLRDVGRLCLQTRLGQLCTTSWKSLIVKGIDPADRPRWDAVLRRHRVNVRHAANELNWQVEDDCPAGLALKHELVRYFNEEDLRTYQLCFAIKTRPKTGLFGSIVVRSQADGLAQTGLHGERYELLHTRDFNPNSKDLVSFRQQVSRENLPWYLAQLCDQFYAQQEAASLPAPVLEEAPAPPAAPAGPPPLHQCRHCRTVYEAALGEPAQGVAPGTPWAALVGYRCPTCDAPAADFAAVRASPGEWLVAP